MKVLVTGATGFVGGHVVSELLAAGHTVFALVRSPEKAGALLSQGVNLVRGDLASLNPQATSLPRVDAVIHLAGLIQAIRPTDFFRINTDGTKRLLLLLEEQRPKKFILVSSLSARGPNRLANDLKGVGPVSHYGQSKLDAESAALEYADRFPVTIVRPPVVYGPGDKATLPLFQMLQKGIFLLPAGREDRLSFVYVRDLAQVLTRLVETPRPGAGPYYPADGDKGCDWDFFLKAAEDAFEKSVVTIRLPKVIAGGVAWINEQVGRLSGRVPFFTLDKYRELRATYWFCSSKNCRDDLKLPAFTGIKTGLKLTRQWYERQGWL